MKPHIRKLQPDVFAPENTLSPPVTHSPGSLLQPTNGSTKSRPIRPNSPLDSSMALTALILLTALFFMGFFSLYLRRFADDDVSSSNRGRRRRPSPYSSSSLPLWRPSNYPKGVDSSTVQSLPLVSYGGDAKHPIDCAICLCEFEEGETVKLIPYCRHAFHPECIDTWLDSHVSCPVCRSSQMFGVGEEVCSGVSQGEIDHGGSGSLVGWTVEDGDAWVEEGREVGPVGVRRTSSWPGFGDRVVLRRTSSVG